MLDDIQTLNQKAREGAYELTAVSYHAYPYIADKYFLMAAGSSVGDGYGPMVVALTPLAPADLKGKRIAVPGKLTTAYLTLRLMQPDFEAVVVPFDKILDAVRDGEADAGLVIHEAQLTHMRERIPHHCGSRRAGGRKSTVCRCLWAPTCCAAA